MARWMWLAVMTVLVAGGPAWGQPVNYTWGNATGNWSVAGNWTGGVAPPSSVNTRLSFGGNNSAYTATNDNPGTFVLNRITSFGNIGSANILAGNPLSFQGASAGIGMNAATTFEVQNALVLDTSVSMNSLSVLRLTGPISGTGGLTTTGRVDLTRDNSYQGATVVSSGQLRISRDNALGSSVQGTTVATGAALELTGGITVFAEPLTINGPGGPGSSQYGALATVGSGTNTYTGAITMASNSSMFVDFGGTLQLNNLAESGGARELTVNGYTNSTLRVFGSLAHTGGTVINSATLRVSAANALADGGAVTLASSGRLTIDDGFQETIGSLTGAAGTTVTLSGVSSRLVIGGSANTTHAGTVTGSGRLDMVGSGTLTLTGTNSHTGGVRIEGGTVAVGGDANLGAAAAPVTLAGGTLRLTASATLARTVALQSGGGAIDTNGQSVTLTGPVTGAGFLDKTGAGTLTLAGNSTGQDFITVIRNGTVSVSASNNLGGGVRFQSGGSAALQATGGLTASFVQTTFASGTLSATAGNALTVSQLFGGNELRIDGAGTVRLTADNASYSGQTRVNSGTLEVANATGSATGSGTVLVNAGGTLSGTGRIAGTVTAAGTNASSLATISPGNGSSASTLTVANGVAFGEWSRLVIAISGNSADVLAVQGNLNLSASTDALVIGSGTLNGTDTYLIATYTGTLTGTFDNFASVTAQGYFVDYSTAGQISFAPVPEPASILAVGAGGLAGLTALRRRRRVTDLAKSVA